MKLINFYRYKTLLYQIVNTYSEIVVMQPSAYYKYTNLDSSTWRKIKQKYLSRILRKQYINTKKVKLIKVIGPVHQNELDIDMYCFKILITNNICAIVGVEANTHTIIVFNLRPYKLSLWERFMLKIGYTSRIQLY